MGNGIHVLGRRPAMVVLALVLFALAACSRQGDERVEASKRKPQQAGQPIDPVRTAANIAGARVAAATGNQQAAEAHVRAISDDIRRSARMPDVFKRIHPESARAAVRPLPRVKSVVWMDRENLMVDGQRYRNMAMLDEVCLALELLGDTLAVVNLQDATAKNGDEAMTLSRNFQLAEGERAFSQNSRPVDVQDREKREPFRVMQGKVKVIRSLSDGEKDSQ